MASTQSTSPAAAAAAAAARDCLRDLHTAHSTIVSWSKSTDHSEFSANASYHFRIPASFANLALVLKDLGTLMETNGTSPPDDQTKTETETAVATLLSAVELDYALNKMPKDS
jgi:hypothetical protein